MFGYILCWFLNGFNHKKAGFIFMVIFLWHQRFRIAAACGLAMTTLRAKCGNPAGNAGLSIGKPRQIKSHKID